MSLSISTTQRPPLSTREKPKSLYFYFITPCPAQLPPSHSYIVDIYFTKPTSIAYNAWFLGLLPAVVLLVSLLSSFSHCLLFSFLKTSVNLLLSSEISWTFQESIPGFVLQKYALCCWNETDTNNWKPGFVPWYLIVLSSTSNVLGIRRADFSCSKSSLALIICWVCPSTTNSKDPSPCFAVITGFCLFQIDMS